MIAARGTFRVGASFASVIFTGRVVVGVIPPLGVAIASSSRRISSSRLPAIRRLFLQAPPDEIGQRAGNGGTHLGDLARLLQNLRRENGQAFFPAKGVTPVRSSYARMPIE
jgi:hypothetical protein